ncbi:hypothetical protein PC112_g23 [Phytophthora cactorum]|nr:hypothetical protein PC112_g23 [Phytophthora cactorum]KAG3105999.1 hypothetical protein PC121_g272 [Phytophthora cactorum]
MNPVSKVQGALGVAQFGIYGLEQSQLMDVPAQGRVDSVGQYCVFLLTEPLARAKFERRSAALWSDYPPHGRTR